MRLNLAIRAVDGSPRSARPRRSLPSIVLASIAVQFVALSWVPPDATAQSLVRSPYLQMGTPTSMIVRWRTDVPSETTLRYGPLPSNLSTTISAPGPVTEHEVSIAGLQPETRYYYSVGTSALTLAGADPDHYFETSPVAGTQRSVRLWVIGDSGGVSPAGTAVQAEYFNFAGDRLADLFLLLGDNAYLDGTDTEYTTKFFNNYPEVLRNTVVWPTPGNHDFSGTPDSSFMVSETGPYYDSFTLPTQGEAGGVPSGTETYYSFDYSNIHFVSFNVYPSGFQAGLPPYNWLVADLGATNQQWIIVYLHFPPYSRGGRDSDTDYWMSMVRTTYAPVFEAAGVDLVLAGHSHSYERSKLIDGHYGVASTLTPANIIGDGDGNPFGGGRYRKPVEGGVPHSGTVYVVNGVGENAHEGTGTLDHPVMVTSLELEGSMVIDIDRNQLNAYFVSLDGDVLDQFGIGKRAVVPSLGAVGLLVLCFAMMLVVWIASEQIARRRA